VGDDRINDARDVRKSKRGMTHLGSWVVDSGFVDFFRRLSLLLFDGIVFGLFHS